MCINGNNYWVREKRYVIRDRNGKKEYNLPLINNNGVIGARFQARLLREIGMHISILQQSNRKWAVKRIVYRREQYDVGNNLNNINFNEVITQCLWKPLSTYSKIRFQSSRITKLITKFIPLNINIIDCFCILGRTNIFQILSEERIIFR